jgi:hypothetical protein
MEAHQRARNASINYASIADIILYYTKSDRFCSISFILHIRRKTSTSSTVTLIVTEGAIASIILEIQVSGPI